MISVLPELMEGNAMRRTTVFAGAWYATAAAPFSPASLFKLDLVTGHGERISIVSGLLGAPNALVHVR